MKNKDTKNYIENILEKDKEINELKSKLSRIPYNLSEGEKLMTVNFASIDQKINYSIICKNTDTFSNVEKKLYEEYPEYGETENFFIANSFKVYKHKTLDDNNIKNNDKIILYNL